MAVSRQVCASPLLLPEKDEEDRQVKFAEAEDACPNRSRRRGSARQANRPTSSYKLRSNGAEKTEIAEIPPPVERPPVERNILFCSHCSDSAITLYIAHRLPASRSNTQQIVGQLLAVAAKVHDCEQLVQNRISSKV